MHKRSTQRAIIGILLTCFCFVFVVASIGMPQPVLAAPVEVVADAPAAVGKVEASFGNQILASAIIGLLNTITMVGQQIAYDMAVGLASGCRGENACAFTKDPGTYFTAVAYDAAGEFIGNLSESWEFLGFSLCNPRIPDVGLSIALGLAEKFQRPKPKCDFVNTINNWQSVVREAQDPHALLKHVSLAFEPGNTDLGQAARASEAFQIHIKKKQEAEKQKRTEGGGILPQSGIISGNVTTPAAVIKSEYEDLPRSGKDNTITSGDVVSGLIGTKSGGIWTAVGTTVLSTFVNTLASRLLKAALMGIFGETANTLPDLTQAIGSAFGGAGRRGAPGLSQTASALLTPQIRVSNGGFEYVAELAAGCQAKPEERSQFQCAIDNKFMVAIQQAQAGSPLTVREAIEKGYLNRGAPFGFVNPAGTPPSEPSPQEGYPYSSMKKLRLLRIIPLGWEFAALKIDQDNQSATLGDVVDGYDKEGTPDSGCQGTPAEIENGESRFCGLVDPNWVLKAPPATCGAIVFSSMVDSSGGGRQEVCADLKHCVSEAASGDCQAWGYCTREKNTWRFDADSCDKQYASCDTFTPQEGNTQSLLENTVDFGACSAENAGCTAYLTAQGTPGVWNSASALVYLDRDAAKCDQSSAGCAEFIVPENAKLNLIQNSGFEGMPVLTGGGEPAHWGSPDAIWGSMSQDSTQSFEGTSAVDPDESFGLTQAVSPVVGGRTYTLSAYAKGKGEVRVGVRLRHGMSFAEISAENTTCAILTPTMPGLKFNPSVIAGNEQTYTRASCTVTLPDAVDAVDIRLESTAAGATGVWVDAVQFEEGIVATGYHAGYAEGVSKLHYRIPPDYLNCTGETTDRPECADYSLYCRREEVGCELYTPASRDATVPGVATALDRCPPGCVGYDTYLKLGSRFEPQFTSVALASILSSADLARLAPSTAPQEDLYPLIPSASTPCPAQFAGCDEFTNLRTEARQYYSDLRACQTPAPDSQTYFTWEGSDTTGYQLKTWSFKRSNAGALTGVAGDELALGQTATNARPPCTNYAVAVTENGDIQVNCEDSGTNQAICDPEDDMLTSSQRADCRAFYDGSGNIFRRNMSRTIISTDECQSFRWTGLPRLPEISAATGENPDQLRGRLEEAACRASHGSWSDTVHQCLYLGAPSLSQSCPAQLNGCRGFRGNTGSNAANVFNETFDPVSIPLADRGWAALGTLTRFEFSGESLVTSEHSLKIEGADGDEGATRALTTSVTTDGVTTTTSLVTSGSSYFLTMNVKGTASRVLQLAVRAGLGASAVEDIFDEEIRLTPEWRSVEIGPLTLQNITPATLADPLAAPKLVIRNAESEAMTFFIDEVTLKEVRDTVYLVKHSSNVPDACDTLPVEAGGGYARGAMLGCRSYTDRINAAHTLKSFTSLCRPRSAGCADLIDTRNSDSPFAQWFNIVNTGVCRGPAGLCNLGVDVDGDGSFESGALAAVNSTSGGDAVCTVVAGATSCTYGPGIADSARNIRADDRLVQADTHHYVVVDPVKSCQAAQAGCQALGNFSGGQSSALIPTVYRKNNPNEYGASLCAYEARSCETWTRSDSSVAYFRAQETGGCTWKTNTAIGTAQYSGWFKGVKQPVGNPSLVNTAEKCRGYGTWNFVVGACVDDAGNTLDGVGSYTHGGVVVPDNKCGGVACDITLCTRGAGGSWKQADTNGDGVIGTTEGVCESEAPCYGAVIAEMVAEHPRIRVDVANTYLIGGVTFGIYRNADALYSGRAGTCPAAQATCTALIDPTDQSEGEGSNGKAYYLKDNARLIAAREACGGKVSRAQGCVLLKNEEDPSDVWSAEQSYLVSDRARGDAVSPVPLPPNGNDTNTIIKVQRDRVCAEWFQCASAEFKWIDKENRYKTVCSILGRCNAAAATPEQGGSISTCGSWIRHPLLNKPPQIDASACIAAFGASAWDGVARKCAIPDETACVKLGGIWFVGPPSTCEVGALKEAVYRLRDRTFGGQEYTGYSIPNLYGIDQMQEVNIGSLDQPRYRLAYVIAGRSCTPGTTGELVPCSGAGENDQYCTTDGQCARAFEVGNQSRPLRSNGALCRGYPERTSPFPQTEAIRGNLSFQNVSRCAEEHYAERAGHHCECDYVKAEYGSETRYYPLNQDPEESPSPDTAVPVSEFCEGSNGDPVAIPFHEADITDAQACQNAGYTWQALKNQRNVYGWPGYCLELDPSRLINGTRDHQACLTWLPIDQLSSAQDIDNLHTDAGFTAGISVGSVATPYGAYYCLLGGAMQNSLVAGTQGPYVPGAYQSMGNFMNCVGGDMSRIRSSRGICESAGGIWAGNGATSGNQIRVKTADVSTLKIYRSDIKHVRIHIEDMGNDAGPANGCYEFDAGDKSNGDVLVTSVRACPADEIGTEQTLSGDEAGVYQAYDFGLPPGDEWWYWGGDDNFNEGDDSRPSGAINGISGFAVPRWMKDQSPASGSTLSHEFNTSDWIDDCDTGALHNANYDGAYVALHFNPDTQQLEHIRTAICTADNSLDGSIGVRLYFHPHCEYVAKIDQSLASQGSAPNLACLSANGSQPDSCHVNGDQDASGAYDFTPATPFMPWGSSSAGTAVDIESTGNQWFLNHNRMEQPSAQGLMDDLTPLTTQFAGWPFGCVNREDCTVNSLLPPEGIGPKNPWMLSGGTVVGTAINAAIGEFKELFAQSSEVFHWNGSNYVPAPSVDWDRRTAFGTTQKGPMLRAVVEGAEETAPGAASSSGQQLAVNGQYSVGSIVQGVNGFLVANLKFWAMADEKHMPIRKFKIDWGDGEASQGNGLYKNAWPECSSSSSLAPAVPYRGFSLNNDACQNQPYNFEHLYSCGGSDDRFWRAGSVCPVSDFRSLYGGCCVFKPRVQATDNWGFCNGNCNASVDGYDDLNLCFGSECTDPVSGTNNPWSEFVGEIVVAP